MTTSDKKSIVHQAVSEVNVINTQILRAFPAVSLTPVYNVVTLRDGGLKASQDQIIFFFAFNFANHL